MATKPSGFRRLFRVTLKLGMLAAIGIGVAVVVKRLTTPPAEPAVPLEPWPPLRTDTPSGSEASEAPAEASKN